MGEFSFWMIVLIASSFLFKEIGMEKGRREVAQGKYECKLETQKNQTVKWKCHKLNVPKSPK